MRVLHIISGDLWAGAETQAFTLLRFLKKERGVEVAAALMNDGELARRLRENDIPVTLFAESELNAWRILHGLRRLMRKWQPDIVHTHRTKENILGSMANRLAGNARSVRTAHGAREQAARGLRNTHKRILAMLDGFCGRRLQRRVIAVSPELAEKLAQDFPREHIVVIENGVDVESLSAQRHPVEFRAREPHATHIGIVGRLVPVKRVDLFLEAARALQEADPARAWRFHVFGEGPLREALRAQAAAGKIADSVTFHGHRVDIIACLAALDLLVMCSDHEGLPMTLLESLAVGTPVVAHAVGGITAVLAGNRIGHPVYEHDASSYAAAVRQALEQTGDADRCAMPLPARYRAEHNARCVRELYESLLTGAAS